jgi:hypothetical protein
VEVGHITDDVAGAGCVPAAGGVYGPRHYVYAHGLPPPPGELMSRTLSNTATGVEGVCKMLDAAAPRP